MAMQCVSTNAIPLLLSTQTTTYHQSLLKRNWSIVLEPRVDCKQKLKILLLACTFDLCICCLKRFVFSAIPVNITIYNKCSLPAC